MTQDIAGTSDTPPRPGLSRELGLMGLAATGICSMLGAAINVRINDIVTIDIDETDTFWPMKFMCTP